jgi:hypothetical protein
MAYLGSRPLVGAFQKIDSISSLFDSTTTTFTLTIGSITTIIGTAQNLLISLNGILQEPGVAYTVSTSNIIFSEAPLIGSTFFGVKLGDVLGIGVPSAGTASGAALGTDVVKNSGTTASAIITSGTTIQRDLSPSAGYFRFNTTLGVAEMFNGTAWVSTGGATGGGSDAVFQVNKQTVNSAYTIPAGSGASCVGPITFNAAVTYNGRLVIL